MKFHLNFPANCLGKQNFSVFEFPANLPAQDWLFATEIYLFITDSLHEITNIG